MNRDLAAVFQSLASDLLTVWGRSVTRTTVEGDESSVLVILDEESVAVGDYGERMEQRWTLDVASASGAAVGDVYTEAGTPTADDPYPDDIAWTAAQLLNDDGYIRRFLVRKGVAA